MQSMYIRIEDVGNDEAMLTFGGIRDDKSKQEFYSVLPIGEGNEFMKEMAIKITEFCDVQIRLEGE